MSFHRRAVFAVCVLGLAFCACSRSAGQSSARTITAATPPGDFVRMTDANAKAYFVRGVVPELQGGSWRWVNRRPELRFRLKGGERRFAMEFAIPQLTFKDTGPVAITWYINDRVLERVNYRKPGNLKFEKTVPADWLAAGAPVIVAAEVDKPWVTPKDKTELGFILVSAGFRR